MSVQTGTYGIAFKSCNGAITLCRPLGQRGVKVAESVAPDSTMFTGVNKGADATTYVPNQLGESIEKLTLGPDDVVVVRNVDRREARSLMESLQHIGARYHNPCIFLHEGQDIATVTRERLRAIGYIHESEIPRPEIVHGDDES